MGPLCCMVFDPRIPVSGGIGLLARSASPSLARIVSSSVYSIAFARIEVTTPTEAGVRSAPPSPGRSRTYMSSYRLMRVPSILHHSRRLPWYRPAPARPHVYQQPDPPVPTGRCPSSSSATVALHVSTTMERHDSALRRWQQHPHVAETALTTHGRSSR